MKLCWASIALFLLMLGTGRAATSKTEISVIVRNEFEKPVSNAAIILDFLGGRQITKLGLKKPIHWEVHTNQEGKAHFPPIPEGTIQLQVVTKRYQTFGEKMEVEGAEKLVKITLKQPQDQYSSHAPLKPSDPPKQ